jgi:hypothetical protein
VKRQVFSGQIAEIPKWSFVDLKAKVLLSVALAEDASQAAIVSSGVQLVNLLRENRIRAEQLIFSVRGE